MVDIPCLPTQTFFCVGYPRGAEKLIATEEKTEIMLAAKWEGAKEHVEGFWTLDCVLVLSQEDVQGMRKEMATATITKSASPKLPFFYRLFGTKKSAENPEKMRFLVYGKDPAGEVKSVVVEALDRPAAFVAAMQGQEKITPAGYLSERQLKGLDMMMEDARTGKSVVVNVVEGNTHTVRRWTK